MQLNDFNNIQKKLTESVDLSDNMIGTPDEYFDAEQRQEAWKDLKDASDDCRYDWQKDTVIDGICPECTGSSCMDGDDENGEDSCYGWGNFGCDGGEMTQRDDGLPNWAEIIKHDKRNAERKDATANYPGDEVVVKQIANMVQNMDDARDAMQQMAVDYPQMGRAQRANLVAQGMKAAGLTKEDMDEAESPYTNSNHSQNKMKKPFGADAHTKPEGGNPQVCDCITSTGAVPNCPECGGTGQTTSPKRNDPKGMVPEADDEMYNKDDFDNVFGSRQYKKEFEYLDDLQASGITNMFGGARYLVQDLGLDKEKADKVLQMWMRSKEQTEDFQEEETDSDSNEAAVAKMIAKALGDDNRWTEMTAHELYAELESTNTELAKVIQLTAKMLYDVKLTEAKNCGCGQDPCKTYGKIKESDDNSHEITLEDNQDFNEEFGVLGYSECDEDVFEAEYQGRTVKLNKPMQGDVKKFKVYVKDPKTKNVKKVNFGHGGSSVKGKSMRIRKSNPKARKSFRARHNCSNPGPKTKARYWSCRKW
jgi:hypothetical protein